MLWLRLASNIILHMTIYYIFSIVNEGGASSYSVSEEAKAEMSKLDVNLRSAGMFTHDSSVQC